jgi:hypothetical protein
MLLGLGSGELTQGPWSLSVTVPFSLAAILRLLSQGSFPRPEIVLFFLLVVFSDW